MTNGDYVRSMNDESLAILMWAAQQYFAENNISDYSELDIEAEKNVASHMVWLKQEMTNAKNSD